MCFVTRQSNTKAKVGVPEFEQLNTQLAYDVKAIIELEDIPNSYVINWDHSAVTSQFMDYGGTRQQEGRDSWYK